MAVEDAVALRCGLGKPSKSCRPHDIVGQRDLHQGCEFAAGVIEMDQPVDLAVATPAALENGAWLRPFRNLIYAMPPYVCSPRRSIRSPRPWWQSPIP